MFPQATRHECPARQHRQPALIDRLSDGPVADTCAKADVASLKISFLQVESRAVFKSHELDVQVGDVFSFRDYSRRPEVAVAPLHFFVGIRRSNSNGVCLLVS